MDTSETYIKMCEKAVEIQEAHSWEEGDYGWQGTPSYGVHCLVSHRDLVIWEKADEGLPFHLIWLPRQDQLQEMVGGYQPHMFHAFIEFVIGCSYLESWGDYPNQWDKCQSYEQLWLAYVMYQKHGKAWNGDAWELVTKLS